MRLIAIASLVIVLCLAQTLPGPGKPPPVTAKIMGRYVLMGHPIRTAQPHRTGPMPLDDLLARGQSPCVASIALLERGTQPQVGEVYSTRADYEEFSMKVTKIFGPFLEWRSNNPSPTDMAIDYEALVHKLDDAGWKVIDSGGKLWVASSGC